MSDEETPGGEDALKDAEIKSGTEKPGPGLPDEGIEGEEGRGTGEGDAGPASGTSKDGDAD
jgi:hypothetical protein